MKKPGKRKGKAPSEQGMLGQKAINLIATIVTDMRCLWAPGAPNEVGIDGYLELCDPETGESLSRVFQVQSKAVTHLPKDNGETFEYSSLKSRDVEYWLNFPSPVLLIIAKPSTQEAYWISLKDYFSNEENQRNLTIRVDKRKSRFTPDSIHDLISLSGDAKGTLYQPPLPKEEVLHSNLLRVEAFPPRIWVGNTDAKSAGEIMSRLGRAPDDQRGGWLFKKGRILSFRDLTQRYWASVCDPQSVEEFETSDWSGTKDPDQAREFVQLLNLTLRADVPRSLRYWHAEELYAYHGTPEDGTIEIGYTALKHESSLSAVTMREGVYEGRKWVWLRHMGFHGQFKRLDSAWFLEISPTYLFTYDGQRIHQGHAEKLKKIKQIEGNRAVLSQVMFWAQQLSGSGNLFDQRNRLIQFGELLKVKLQSGISDKHWKDRDDNPPSDLIDPEGEDDASSLDPQTEVTYGR